MRHCRERVRRLLGLGFYGQLGDGGQSNAIVPTLTNSMPGNMKAVAIDASTSLVCAVLENGSVACWGSGSYGMLGNGVENNLVKPPGLTLPIGAEAIDVATRTDGACALLVNGSVSCWGRDNSGQLGSGLVNRSQGSSTQLSLSPNYTSPLPNGKKATGDHGWLRSHLRPARRWERCLLGFKQPRTTRSWKHIRGCLSPNAHPFVGCSGDSH